MLYKQLISSKSQVDDAVAKADVDVNSLLSSVLP
jgi:hypothetical protein